jgi:hypothetical protein
MECVQVYFSICLRVKGFNKNSLSSAEEVS